MSLIQNRARASLSWDVSPLLFATSTRQGLPRNKTTGKRLSAKLSKKMMIFSCTCQKRMVQLHNQLFPCLCFSCWKRKEGYRKSRKEEKNGIRFENSVCKEHQDRVLQQSLQKKNREGGEPGKLNLINSGRFFPVHATKSEKDGQRTRKKQICASLMTLDLNRLSTRTAVVRTIVCYVKFQRQMQNSAWRRLCLIFFESRPFMLCPAEYCRTGTKKNDTQNYSSSRISLTPGDPF